MNQKSFTLLLLFVTGIQYIACDLPVFTTTTAATAKKSSSECICPDQCPNVKHCQDTKLDDCGCCLICIKHLNETCGPSIGTCADNLICKHANGPDLIGKCSLRWPEPCLKAKCEVIFQPKCPEDSRLHLPKFDDECCPKKGQCVCDPDKCSFTNCLPGYERLLVQQGVDKPGQCCDEYECKLPAKDCNRVTCDPVDDTLMCPEDSIKPQSYVPDGGCCAIQPDCRCKPGLCKPVQCPSGLHAVITKKGDGVPGNCCDYFKCVSAKDNSIEGAIARRTLKCFDTVNNQTYTEGEKFFRSACIQCECHSGIIKCKEMTCPNMKKKCATLLRKDECCPVCIGCRDEQFETRIIGQYWQKDECTNCTCNDGFQITCSTPICKTDCLNPKKVAGECCPVCDGPTVIEPPIICPSLEHCPLRCEHGLQKNQWGCFQCKCAESIEPTVYSDDSNCEELTEDNCDKQCAHGYMRDQKGCPVCKCAKCPPIDTCFKHCLYGFETNSLGCPVCKCRAKSKIDARLQISPSDLAQSDKDKCLSIIGGDEYIERDSGEWWTDGNCRQCFCQHGKEYCSLISCQSRPKTCPVEFWKISKDSCCPSCETEKSTTTESSRHGQTVCHSPGDGRLYVDGETWNIAGCVSCTCRVGHVLCTAKQCPPIPCDDPVKSTDDECCLKCPNLNSTIPVNTGSITGFCMDDNGIARPVGDSWRKDECTSCQCLEDQEEPLCFTEKCPDDETDCQGKPLMIKGKCCSVCSDSLQTEAICSFDNHTYTVNEEFKSNECRNCTCKHGGHMECIELQCAQCDYEEFVIPGQCCPICKDEAASTEYREADIELKNEAEELNGLVYISYFFVVVLILSIVVSGLVAFIVKRRKKPLKGLGTLPQPPKVKEHGSKIRNTSESESANMSLLSNHSDSSTAPSTNSSSDHSGHSETTPLTKQQPRLTAAADLV